MEEVRAAILAAAEEQRWMNSGRGVCACVPLLLRVAGAWLSHGSPAGLKSFASASFTQNEDAMGVSGHGEVSKYCVQVSPSLV